MRVSKAAEAAGVTTATFKFYIREGLVPAGQRLNQTQTSYDEAHVRRVRLVRALIETGGLSVSQARTVLATLEHSDLRATFAAAQHAMSVGDGPHRAPSTAARELTADVVEAQGWNATADNPGFSLVAQVVDGLVEAGLDRVDEFLSAYAAAADRVAEADMAALRAKREADAAAELMVVGTVLGDTLLAGLRRLAQEHHSTHALEIVGPPDDRADTASTREHADPKDHR